MTSSLQLPSIATNCNLHVPCKILEGKAQIIITRTQLITEGQLLKLFFSCVSPPVPQLLRKKGPFSWSGFLSFFEIEIVHVKMGMVVL